MRRIFSSVSVSRIAGLLFGVAMDSLTKKSTADFDLRSWLATLEAHGEPQRITAEAHLNSEIGAIARIILGLQGPGLLLENITGYRDERCTKFLTGTLGNRGQICLLLELPLETTDRQLVADLKRCYRQGIPPGEVVTGPVNTRVLNDSSLDLNQFPVPRCAMPSRRCASCPARVARMACRRQTTTAWTRGRACWSRSKTASGSWPSRFGQH